MELFVRVRWRHMSPADLRFELERYHTVGDLLTAANDFCDASWDPSQPVYLERLVDPLPLEATVIDSGLVSGDTLRFEMFGVDQIDPTSRRSAVSCDVTAGPEAGRSFELHQGVNQVGRNGDNDVVLDDPTVSSHHMTVVVDPELATRVVPDPGAVNPVTMNGVPISEATLVGPTDIVQLGATGIALRVFSRSSDTERDQLGQVPFRRTPHRPIVVAERKLRALGGVPTKPEKRRFSPLPMLAPLVMGLGMFLITRMPYMLMMMAMSPMMAIFNAIEGRKTGANTYSDRVADLGVRLERRRTEIDEALLAERAQRTAQSPDLADLARRATMRTLDLWSRQRDHDEFLRIRLGVGTVPSKIMVEPESTGDEYLLEAIAAATEGHKTIAACPMCINLAELGVVGLFGSPADVRAMTSSVIVQAATLHSPEDLAIVILEGYDQGFSTWVKWLPHARSATSPIAGDHMVTSNAEADEMLRQMISVARMRTEDEQHPHRWPWLLVVVDETAAVDPALLSQLLDLCPAAGISVVIGTTSDARVPRQATAVCRCVPAMGGELSSVWFTDPKLQPMHFEPEPANARLVDQICMSLAPLRDASSASDTSAIPRIVPLLTLWGGETPSAESVTARWTTPKPYGLRAPIGVGPSGPLELDLVDHGPHALIGGTSGAGKSELLQSIIAGLVHEYPPTRLTFLFIDFKGGASTVVFNDTIHTVGYVTNLDASLSLRALTSLRAELNHRMRLMEGKAKDLAEMIERYPDEAPPSLVIVVDEFATLVKEVPDFVDGMIDIAQRGRSLGVHLILATQTPSGSVSDKILANTNLRISLRMLDGSESKVVIGVPAAAEIPLPLKGRGFARLGPADLVEFQSAYTGASLARDDGVIPVAVAKFGEVPTPFGATATIDRRSVTRLTEVTPATSRRRTTSFDPADSSIPPPPRLKRDDTVQLPLPAPVPGIDDPLPAPTLAEPRHDTPPAPVAGAAATPPPDVAAVAAVAHDLQRGFDDEAAVFDRDGDRDGDGRRGSADEGPTTHLEVLLHAIDGAAEAYSSPRRPWQEMLPEVLPWFSIDRPAEVSDPLHKGRLITLGMLDDPAAQQQYPAVFDLEQSGGLLIGGSGGSGKTTALRAAAVAATVDATPDEVALFVLDCASRSLAPLRALPHVAEVATGDDIESITRLITLLTAEVDRRRLLLTDLSVQAETLTAYLEKGRKLPRVVLLVDGFQNLGPILGTVKPMEVGPLDWFGEFQRVITDGRQFGIHTIITTDRRIAVPALLQSSIGSRLVLRQTDDGGYMDYGISSQMSRGLVLPNGRGLWGDQLLQIGVVSDDPAGAAQGQAIADYAAGLGGEVPVELQTAPPPDTVSIPLLASSHHAFPLGRRDVSGDLVEVSIEHHGFVVSGPPRSGRTTALRNIATSLIAAGHQVWSIGLGDALGGTGRHCGPKVAEAGELLDELATLCEALPGDRPYVLIVDDVDRYEEAMEVSMPYERIVKTEECVLIGACETNNLSGYTQSALIGDLRKQPSKMLLRPENASEIMQYTNARAQLRPGFQLSAGRGVLVVDREASLVQVGAEFET